MKRNVEAIAIMTIAQKDESIIIPAHENNIQEDITWSS
jgi:hypothetical protein